MAIRCCAERRMGWWDMRVLMSCDLSTIGVREKRSTKKWLRRPAFKCHRGRVRERPLDRDGIRCNRGCFDHPQSPFWLLTIPLHFANVEPESCQLEVFAGDPRALENDVRAVGTGGCLVPGWSVTTEDLSNSRKGGAGGPGHSGFGPMQSRCCAPSFCIFYMTPDVRFGCGPLGCSRSGWN